MSKVFGMSLERSLEIEASNVRGGTIESGKLILVTHAGRKIMAGDLVPLISAAVQSNTTLTQTLQDMFAPVAADYLSDLAVVQSFPTTRPPRTSLKVLPIEFTYRYVESLYPSGYPSTYVGTWKDGGDRLGDIPLLTSSGKLYSDAIPDSVATKTYVKDTIRESLSDFDVEVISTRRYMSNNVPLAKARLAESLLNDSAFGFVAVGSSTTAANPGFAARLKVALDTLYPVSTPTTPQYNNSAIFTPRTIPGIHYYNAGHGGTVTANYLTDEECDRIAALNPSVIQHMVMSNDYRTGVDPEVCYDNLVSRLAYLDSVLPSPAQHVIVHQYERIDGAASGNYTWSQYGEVATRVADLSERRVAFDLNALYRSTGVPNSDPLDLISTDNVHQTSKGYAYMADLFSSFYVGG